MLREGGWEARAFCSRPWLKWIALAIPAAIVVTAAVLYCSGRAAAARDALISGIGLSPLAAAPLLPIYTPSRGRIFRYAKWVTVTGAVVLLFGPQAFKWSWLLFSCLWPLAWTEWTRASIRRKLPIAAWPKHLYL